MNNKAKNTAKKISVKLTIILLILICSQYIFTGIYVGKEIIGGNLKKKVLSSVSATTETANNDAQATSEDPNEGQYLRLTDLNWRSESNVGWGKLRKNESDDNHTKLSIKREGSFYTFDYGIFAHANSNVYYDISEYSEKYHYLTMYVGLNKTATSGDGVKFWVYTSNNDRFYTSGAENWTTQSLVGEEKEVDILPNQNAVFVKVDIRGAKYLRLQAYQKSGNGSDHAVYIDPMFITDEYKEKESKFPDISEYDQKIKTYANKDLSDPKYELLVLQRKFVSSVGSYALERFTEEDPDNQATIDWLMNDLENLRYYVLGGTPTGGYYNSLKVLTRLLKEYKNDFNITEEISAKGKATLEKKNLNIPATKGSLYKRMTITLSLTHSAKVNLWMQDSPTNQSDAVKRYEQFKYMYDNGMFTATEQVDITPWFETYSVEEMRYIMQSLLDDEEVIWLNEYTQSKINANPGNAWGLLTPHSYIAYVMPNYSDNRFYDDANYDYFNDLLSVPGKGELQADGTRAAKKLYDYGISRGTVNNKINKLWMNFRNKFGTGAVCGGISKLGHNIRNVHAIPAAVIGQPGHAAIVYYTQNSNGQGYWGIDNDVSGWTKSERSQRLLLGWGSDWYYRGTYNIPYMILGQEALNDFNNLVKAEELLMTIDVYKEDKAKQEQIYREAIKVQSINLDAWVGLIKLYLADTSKTEEDYYNLAKEMMENLKYFPFTFYDLAKKIKPKFTTNEYKFKYSILETRTLTEAKNYYPAQGEEAVLQPGVTRTLASSILGTLDTSLAKFSFDGADSGKIKLSSRFDGSGIRWDYSLDGKKTWNEVFFTAEEDHKIQLTEKQIESITAENDIYVHIVGVNYNEENLYKIDIQESAGLPSEVFANDRENRMVGVNLSTEWRYTENDKWTAYSVASPDLTGDKTVQLRQGATGTRLASNASSIYTFTKNNEPDTRKYIPVSHLSLKSVSTEATGQGKPARNALDANYNTIWHSAWNGTDTKRFIEIKLDNPVYLSAVEFIPAGGGNGRIVDGIVYGKLNESDEWIELSKLTSQQWTQQANDNETAERLKKCFEIAEPKKVQYVKIVANRTNGNWFTARAFNFYQDITKNPIPTAGIAYSTTEKTNEPVVARLINPSTEITITNNNGNDSYVFTENGNFTFEFEDANGNIGTAIAKVDWIDKSGPTADVKYKLDDDKKLIAVLDKISEDVYLLDKNNKKTNFVEVENGKVVSISYLDDSENEYKIAELDENRVTKKITYQNTTGKVSNVKSYVTTFENGNIKDRICYGEDGNPITVSDEEMQELRKLETIRSNPLEFYLEKNEEYEFRLLDKASNIAYKNIKVDFIENDTKILASDITYSTTMLTKDSVIATINPYVIDMNGEKTEAVVVNNNGNKTYTFEKDGQFTFEYEADNGEEDLDNEVKTHTAKVNWIDKKNPTAKIKYTTSEDGSKVVVTLVDESEQITITNNGGKRDYTFTKNDEFTFKFQDKAGNEGTATAKVDWIGKEQIKGDINHNGEIDLDDLAKMKLHFLEMEMLTDDEVKRADMDGDGEITVADIADIKLIILESND